MNTNKSRIPSKNNVAGDFYVEEGCCLTCSMPIDTAPKLFAYPENENEENYSCYVQKQPVTPAEFDNMMEAFAVADIGCIRYKGKQRVIQIRLVKANEGMQCDGLPILLSLEARLRQKIKLWKYRLTKRFKKSRG
jgi:hypothetical protein